MTQGSKYTDEELEKGFTALLGAGGNASAASRVCGIPASTLRDWKRTQFHDEFVEVRREKRSSLIDEVWHAAQEVVNELRAKVHGMSVTDLLRTFTTLTDKGLAISGEAVDRIDLTSGDRPLEGMSDDQRIERLFSIVDQARARSNSKPGD